MLVVGANLTIDRTLLMERLLPGHVQRPRSATATGGGKAVNVCRAATAHGVRPRFIGNLPGTFGALVGTLLQREGHDLRAVATTGEIRSATIIIEDSLRTTVLNEPGPALAGHDRSALITAVREELPGHRVLVLSGSLPPGDDQFLYAELTDLAHAHGAIVVLDTAREALSAALPHKPDVVTPNLGEAWAVLGRSTTESVEPESADVRQDAAKAAAALCAAGATHAIVTVGRFGMAYSGPSTPSAWVTAPIVHEVNPIGAGDSFVAGLAVGLELGEPMPHACLRAVATGSASVATALAGQVLAETMHPLRARLTWEPA